MRDEQDLIEEARRGDLDAFSDLIRLHQAQVRAYLARYVRHRDAIDDLAQETFLAAFRSLHAFRGTSSLSLWLLGIARNQALMFLRRELGRRAGRSTFEALAAEALAEDLARAPLDDEGASREIEALRGCLRELPESSAEMVRRHYFERMSASQIARATDRTPGAVWVALMRVRDLLRRCVERKMAMSGVADE